MHKMTNQLKMLTTIFIALLKISFSLSFELLLKPKTNQDALINTKTRQFSNNIFNIVQSDTPKSQPKVLELEGIDIALAYKNRSKLSKLKLDFLGETSDIKVSKTGIVEGHFHGYGDNSEAYFHIDENRITGTFKGPSGSGYQIKTLSDGSLWMEVTSPMERYEEAEGQIVREGDVNGGKNKMVDGLDSGEIIDVMVVYTQEAMCLEANLDTPCDDTESNRAPIKALIKLAVDNNNVAHQNSQTGMQLNLVHTYMDTSYVEPYGQNQILTHLTNNGDGELDNVHKYRNQYGADLVMMMGSIGSGIAWVNSSSNYAFAYMNRSYVWYHTFAHELGHNFGCYHNREDSYTQSEYAHGYQDPKKQFRSILSYDCPYGCTRVNFYSSSSALYKGMAIGTTTDDCARKIKERRYEIANFRQSKNTILPSPTSAPTMSPLEYYLIKSKSKGNFCLQADSFDIGAELSLNKCNPLTSNQKFIFDQSNRIQSLDHDNRCFEKQFNKLLIGKCRNNRRYFFNYNLNSNMLLWKPDGKKALGHLGNKGWIGKKVYMMDVNYSSKGQVWYLVKV